MYGSTARPPLYFLIAGIIGAGQDTWLFFFFFLVAVVCFVSFPLVFLVP